ncbi:purple acid phosphatase family protein [Dawidia soli]|nr:metallophosphoesterase family protein [Dawidia soli]
MILNTLSRLFWAFGLVSGWTSALAQVPTPQPPTRMPDRVILNVTATPETSFAVNWRTDTTVATGTLEWTVATDGPEFAEQVDRQPARRELLQVKQDDGVKVIAHYFSAHVEGLTPGRRYVYRVGNRDAWSEWYQLRLPDMRHQKLSFLYFGDAQNEIKSMWSRVIREAFKTAPQVDFMLHAGDLIHHYDNDAEWGEWFYAGNFLHAMVPSLATPGNHEYHHGRLSPQWQPQFNLPQNGPAGLKETCYAVNYSDLKVISLDAVQIDHVLGRRKRQLEWLDSVLTNDPRKWTVVTLHYPVFSTAEGRDNEKLRERLKPLLDKHHVDLVLQGHDHAYGRGRVGNVPTGAAYSDRTSGTMYVVSVSGPKMYGLSASPWMERRAGNTQLFQVIHIEGDVLSYEAFTATGTLYDAFDLQKTAGKLNTLINKIPPVDERR